MGGWGSTDVGSCCQELVGYQEIITSLEIGGVLNNLF
jgi:hypothetical protein